MNCVELQESLASIEDGSSPEQRAHLQECPHCSVLVEDLLSIASSATALRACAEPSPRVWNSIEIALRQEGLIRPQPPARHAWPAFHTPAWVRWMVPAAAVLLLSVTIYLRDHSLLHQLAHQTPPAVTVPYQNVAPADASLGGLNDDDLLQEVALQSPALQAQYSDSLRRANEYIRDEQAVLAANPDDDEARRSLMEAYQQKAMLFELALDRSLQ